MASGDAERWDEKYRSGSHGDAPAPDWLEEFAAGWSAAGRALDVAAGSGRVAVWLAARGLDTLAVDVSGVGLERARERARAAGREIRTRELDLEADELPAGPFEVITCFHYLQRDLFPELVRRLSPGGWLCAEIMTLRNLERHARPSARFLLEPGELRELARPLEPAFYREGWFDDRCVARLAARRPADSA
ncbi:MAG: class I SAM-dependent methyltransferase [Proteobacteria bacterium]|nr:class I SAM-dependent methyltransferase [Pseudomonadota bacterium]